MSNLIPSPGDGLVAAVRADRAASRFEQRTYAQTRIALAQIEQAADLQAARVEAVAYVGKQGMQAVAFVSQVEQQLAQLVPLAAMIVLPSLMAMRFLLSPLNRPVKRAGTFI